MTSELPLAGYAAVQDYLFGLKAAGLKFGVDRMRILAASLGHPERAVPCVHVAGTNGKGSVSAMLESVLRASGRRTGLYTSPHLVRLGERVQVDRTHPVGGGDHRLRRGAAPRCGPDRIRGRARRPAELLRVHDGDGVPAVREEALRLQRYRGRPRRPPRRDQHRRARGVRRDVDRAGPLRHAGQHARGDSRREGRDHQAGAPRRDRADAARGRGHAARGWRRQWGRGSSRSGRSSATT